MASCPRCTTPLLPADVSGAKLAACKSCGGVALDRATLVALHAHPDRHAALETFSAESAQRAMRRVDAAKVAYLPCFECAGTMARKNYLGCSGVIIDQCVHHGAWLDAGELGRIVAFLVAGGADKAAKFRDNQAGQSPKVKQPRSGIEPYGSDFDFE